MNILHISDTHGRHRMLKPLPPADVLVHSGDVTQNGTKEELDMFLQWLGELPYGHKIFVCGNHDKCLYDALTINNLPANVHFLQDSGVTISGVSFYGLGYGHQESSIPMATDVVVTHEPPYGILDFADRHWGNEAIRQRVMEVKPSYHLFGHAHGVSGIETHDGITFSNAALLDHRCKIVAEPRVITTFER